jgi:hypothetical protein
VTLDEIILSMKRQYPIPAIAEFTRRDYSLSLGHPVRQRPISVDARQFAYATIVNGGRFTQAEQIFVFCHIKPPPESQFYQ